MGGFRYAHPVRVSGYSVTPNQSIAICILHTRVPDYYHVDSEARGKAIFWGNGLALINGELREKGIAAEVHPIYTTSHHNDGKEADEWLFWTRIERRKTAPWEEEEVDLEIRQQLQDRLGAPADMAWSTKVIRV
ncbi:hypothetical protein C8R44DRAFT_727918 [Mycena epipterygia]|nr:hypothetical protein C8R44DRAFT_727918 [Mycena epipterygia]